MWGHLIFTSAWQATKTAGNYHQGTEWRGLIIWFMEHECYPSPWLRPPLRLNISCNVEIHDISLDAVSRVSGRWDKRIFCWQTNGRFFNRTQGIRRIIDASIQDLNSPDNIWAIDSANEVRNLHTCCSIGFNVVIIEYVLTGLIPKSVRGVGPVGVHVNEVAFSSKFKFKAQIDRVFTCR